MSAVYGRARTVAAVLVGGLGLAEALTGVNPMLVVSPAVVGCGTGAAAFLTRRPGPCHPGACHPVGGRLWSAVHRQDAVACLLGAVAGPAVAGLVVFLGWPAVVLVALLMATAPAAVDGMTAAARHLQRWLSTPPGHPGLNVGTPARPPREAAAPTTSTPSPRSVLDPLPVLDAAELERMGTAELCWQWRVSFTWLAGLDANVDLGRRAAVVSLRQAYLDEMSRRDPAGFRRWLHAGARPAGDPTRYLHDKTMPTPPNAVRVSTAPPAPAFPAQSP